MIFNSVQRIKNEQGCSLLKSGISCFSRFLLFVFALFCQFSCSHTSQSQSQSQNQDTVQESADSVPVNDAKREIDWVGVKRMGNLLNPYIGCWHWEKNVIGNVFNIFVGERNDSLLFDISGFFYNRIEQTPQLDKHRNPIAQVRVPITYERTIHTDISPYYIHFYSDYRGQKRGEITMKLINDRTMLWTLTNNDSFWPDSAIMIRTDTINYKFSLESEEP